MTNISMDQIKSLRSRTGSGIAVCKEALVANGGNEEKAIDWLRQKGIASQAKRSGKDASEGIIAMLLEGNAGTLVSLKCETDFVAKSEDFWGIARDLCPLSIVNSKDLPNQALNGTKVSDLLVDKSAIIKENIQLGEVATLKSEPDTYVYGYAHGNIVPLPTIGIIGVLVRISKPNDDFGKKIAMHVAAMNPEVISYSQIPSDIMEREKEVASAKVDQSKPEAVQSAMLEGMLKKALKDKVLLSQDYEDYESGKKYTIEQFAKEKGIEILEFKRIEILK
ncbi:translation elongation factor Ts [Candidatus Cytomitobacter indipagum]|uniref:Elongation factor Ts n=1 Tax=Candidatus Cytomitobacter indipagum TaxID=2601575 RepID=A0A5C0UET7_9PROT|nr:translation elongation factor Ts [Candidatus Cytomitobacter indipagum]QEK38201.1 translation elongation factor Ts [Candidatus Cytomitobacter indipagum]